jgi:sortase A
MARKFRPEDLSENELRRLLIAKRRASRQRRLDQFRQSGRLVDVAPNLGTRETEARPAIDIESPLTPRNEVEIGKQRRQRLADRALLFIEVAAILGLFFVLFNGIGAVRVLNEQVAAALIQPSLTPTPLITVAVLPSGHTPPTDPGGAQPNFDEIPSHLPVDREKFLDSFYNLPVPTPSPEQAIRIQIPAINIDAPIVQGDGWEQLKQGVGQHLATTRPGQPGNLVLSAHNDIFGEIFRHLDKLQPGDEIIVYTNVRAFTYVINEDFSIVLPTSVDVLNPTDSPTVTLISCYPYLVNDKRIVVTASLVDS